MEQPDPGASDKNGVAIREGHHQESRRQREANPGRQTTEPTRPQDAEGKTDLAAGWSRQGLSQSDKFSQSTFAAPSPPFDNLLLEIAEMSHRAAKGGTAEAEKDEEHLSAGSPRLLWRG
jgi:hypothetical protein